MLQGPKNRSDQNVNTLLALSWLGTDQHASGVLETARNLIAAERAVRQALPAGIAAACRVARIDRQCITLAVPAAAHASKLRQLGPTVLRQLEHAGWNLTELKVRVQGALGEMGTQLSPREVQPLGSTALQAFGALHDELAPGPLSDAIQRLLLRHGAGDQANFHS